MVCLGGTLLCPAASWGDFFSNMPFTFSFAKVFLLLPKFSQLVSFTWNSQKCTISQNIWCLIKTPPKKTSPKHFFKGVVHEQPWSTIVWFVWGVHYCVQMLPGVMFFKHSLYLFPLLKFYSFMVFLWYYYWISMEFLWDFHDVSMIFLGDFYGISEGMLWDFYDVLMGFPLDSYGISMVFLWCFYDISMGFLLDSCGISIGFLWDFQGISMMFLWYFYGIIIGILLGFLCGSYAIPLLKFLFPLLKLFLLLS